MTPDPDFGFCRGVSGKWPIKWWRRVLRALPWLVLGFVLGALVMRILL